jgi:hypothetical protein
LVASGFLKPGPCGKLKIHILVGPNPKKSMRFPFRGQMGFPRTCRDNQAVKMALSDLHIPVELTDFPLVERRKGTGEEGDPLNWCRDASPGDFPHYRFFVSDYRTMNKHDDMMWKIRIVTLS